MNHQQHPEPTAGGETGSIVLFDGVCNLCNSSVTFIIEHDPRGRFRFAPIQSPVAEELLKGQDIPPGSLDSVVLIENGKAYTRSSAALRIARRLSGLWPALFLSIIVPRPIRDAVYNLVARNRYRWFGKKEACMMPTPELKRRFL